MTFAVQYLAAVPGSLGRRNRIFAERPTDKLDRRQ
jgi:hypothetical protein